MFTRENKGSKRSKLLKIFNAPIKKSKTKIIAQIISIFREQTFNQIFEPEFKELVEKKRESIKRISSYVRWRQKTYRKEFKREEEELRSRVNILVKQGTKILD